MSRDTDGCAEVRDPCSPWGQLAAQALVLDPVAGGARITPPLRLLSR